MTSFEMFNKKTAMHEESLLGRVFYGKRLKITKI